MIKVTATHNGVTYTINGNNQFITGTISQEIGAINSFEFEILPKNAGFDLIQSRKTIIRAVNTITGREEFAGRVLLASKNMSSDGLISKSVTCESFLGYLCDSVQPYAPEDLYTLNDFIDLVLSNHNAQVETEKQIFRGKVDVEVADTDNVYKGLQYETTFETLKSKLVDVYGGEMEIEEIDGVLYLNYLQQIGETRTTKISLGRNMQDASREVSPLNIVTRLIPLGAKLKELDEDGNDTENETEERLTIKGYTPAATGEQLTVPWIDDVDKQKELGVVVGVLDLPDVTEQSNLYKKAVEYFTTENLLELSHTLTALDLREIGQDIDGLNCGDSYPVENELIGLNEVLRITKKNIDINAPYKSNITIGEKKATFSQIQADNTEKVNSQITQIKGDLQQVENSTNTVKNQVVTQSTEILKSCEEIVLKATEELVTETEYNEFKEATEASLSVSAEDITMKFTTTSEQINGVTDEMQSKFNEIYQYISFADGNITLGTSENAITLTIENDRISFKKNGYEFGYWDGNNFYTGNIAVQVNERAQFGDFAFVPRTDGSLSFLKVGG